jgi:small subunit ribosomal protein S1
MAGTERQNSSAESPKALNPSPQPPKKPLQVMHISKREEQDRLRREAEEARAAADAAAAKAEQSCLQLPVQLTPRRADHPITTISAA